MKSTHYNTSLIHAIAFTQKYGIDNNSVSVAYHKKHKFVKKISGDLYVDEKALIKRREFYNKVWNKAHDNYFAITEHIKDNQLYKFLAKVFGENVHGWREFLRDGLFSLAFKEKSILSYRINYKLWAFFRASTFLIRSLMRHERLVGQEKMRRIKSGGLKR